MKHFVLLSALSFLVLGVVTFLGDIWESDKSLALAQSEVKLGERITEKTALHAMEKKVTVTDRRHKG
jgi:hypothetical protein